MANLFAYRARDPREMKQAADPIGPENDKWLDQLAKESELIVAGWGNHGNFRGRSAEVIKRFDKLYCLKQNKSAEPAHPLFLKATLVPIRLGW